MQFLEAALYSKLQSHGLEGEYFTEPSIYLKSTTLHSKYGNQYKSRVSFSHEDQLDVAKVSGLKSNVFVEKFW